MSDDIWNGRPPLGPPEATAFTADAAKLRDNLTKLLAHIEDGPYIGAEGVADVVLNWVKENIPNFSLQLARGNLQNTRPQPAPPEGDPDAIIAELKLAIANAVEGDDPGSVVSVPLVVAQRILDRLGLAARPKVEDADEWLKSTELYRQWRDMKAKLAEREAELAKADAVVADYAFGKNIVGGAPFPGTVMEFSKAELNAMSRHAARQQQRGKDNG